jgi:hypothetical protein
MVRELLRFDMVGLDGNKMYEMGTEELIRFDMMGTEMGEHCSNMESGVRERAEFEMRWELCSYTVYEVRRMMGFKEELWDRWYRASPKGHHP